MHATIRPTAFRLIAATFLLLGVAMPARADDKPLHMVSAYAAGGVADILMRLMSEQLRISLGRPVIVENKPGAAGRMGTQYVKTAPADGSVLLFTPIAPMSIFPLVYNQPGYDPVADFQPVSQIAAFDFGVAVGPQSPVRTLSELIAWLKADPAQASFGTPAAGSLPHFVGVQFAVATGIELRHVPYKGNAPGLADLMGGHLPLFFTSSQDLAEGHKRASCASSRPRARRDRWRCLTCRPLMKRVTRLQPKAGTALTSLRERRLRLSQRSIK